MKSRLSSRALRHAAMAASLLAGAAFLGCGSASEEAPPAHAPIIGRYPMRPLITDPRVAREIGEKALAKIGYEEIIRLAVQKEWLRYTDGNTDHVLVQAAAAAGFWPIFTPWAVTAGVTSQVDTPAPGPADVVAIGILVIGLIDAGILDGTILTSAGGVETATVDTAGTVGKDIAEAARRKQWEKKCLDHYEACIETPVSGEDGNHWRETRCGNCYYTCLNKKAWPTEVGNGSCEYWKRDWRTWPN